MWKIILNLLKNDWVQKILLVGVIGLLTLVMFKQCENQDAINRQNEQNRTALTDNVRILENKIGELTWTKAAFAAELADMKKFNIQLYNEAMEINGKVQSLQNINASLIIDEIKKSIDGLKPKDVVEDGGIKTSLPWIFEEQMGSFSYYLEGETNVFRKDSTLALLGSNLMKQEYRLQLKTYITMKDGILEGGVEPLVPTPGLTFDIETGIFNMDSQDVLGGENNFVFGIGPYIGVGYGNVWNPTGSAYNGFGWSVGIGASITYKIFSF